MMDFKKIEEEMLEFWDKNQIYKKVKGKGKKGKKFYFLQGPPYTSGKLHIGHAWNNNMKDIALRFFRLNGYNVWDRAGYDMHGLPTENKVQKELNLKDKEEIIKYGIEKFNKKCQEFSTNAAKAMNQDLKRMGIWMDFEDPYLPVTNEFMSSEWMLIKKASEQKRLYKGKKIMHWCGECETSLAKHELEYQTVTDNSIFLKFPIKNKKNEYLIIWTTTPWTIPYNLAVMVNPELDYVKSEVETSTGKEKWITAKQLSGVLISGFLGLNSKIIEEFKGSRLQGLEYIHPFYKELGQIYDKLKKESPKVHTVILSKEYVDTTAGSGLVHCAPGCGPEDYEVGRENNILPFNTLDEKGFLTELGEFSKLRAKINDKKFIEKLKELGNLIEENPVEHEYAHCWRCSKPVIFRTTEQWFLKTEDLIQKILEYNKKVNWVPKTVKNSYESWIANLKDNGITRQRFWGTPVPIWECECKNTQIFGSIEELEKEAIGKLPENLHKPWIDNVKIKCSKCKKEMSRIPDIIDVWIDSGTVSWNCLHYPKRKDLFEEFFPADLIIEASEQARLWFSMLQICSTIMFNKSSYKGVFGHGMILDFQGIKMSKSLGNIISPYEVIDKYSSEILRYYICETAAGKNINFNWEEVKQKQRNLLVLLNTANYLIQLKSETKKQKLEIEEKYILSRLNDSIENVTNNFKSFNFDKTITEIEKLFLDISRIYIRLTRDKSNENPLLIFETLKESFIKTLQMFSTICPLITEKIWQQLRENGIVKEESIHLTSWPKSNKKLINKKLEENFQIALEIIEKGLAIRDKEQIGLKWPLQKATVYLPKEKKIQKEFESILLNQLNVKKIDFKSGKEIQVSLETKLTPELEAEGFAREISRKVQAARKEASLVKKDLIELEIISGFNDKLKIHEKSIKEKVGAKIIFFVEEDKKFSHFQEGKIKEIKFKIRFNKI